MESSLDEPPPPPCLVSLGVFLFICAHNSSCCDSVEKRCKALVLKLDLSFGILRRHLAFLHTRMPGLASLLRLGSYSSGICTARLVWRVACVVVASLWLTYLMMTLLDDVLESVDGFICGFSLNVLKIIEELLNHFCFHCRDTFVLCL